MKSEQTAEDVYQPRPESYANAPVIEGIVAAGAPP